MKPVIALFWDESHLWGLLLWHFLKHCQADFCVLSGEDIAKGQLNQLKPKWLIVPGGWASLKYEKLGYKGQEHLKKYLNEGGNYLGFCGGAGLALTSPKTLGLCPLKRKKFEERLPNFSGDIWCKVHATGETLLFPVWWPSQFEWSNAHPDLKIIASYQYPGKDFWVSDLKLENLDAKEINNWQELYAINLDPKSLKEEPCIIQGKVGKGQYILSYPHLETPNSPSANQFLQNLLKLPLKKIPDLDLFASPNPDNTFLAEIFQQLKNLIRIGEENFLVIKRRKWLLAWRRGIPGSYFNSLLGLLYLLQNMPPNFLSARTKDKLNKDFQQFYLLSQKFILKERYLLSKRPSSPLKSSDPDQQRLKNQLFGSFPGYGGLYKELITPLDSLALQKIKLETGQNLL